MNYTKTVLLTIVAVATLAFASCKDDDNDDVLSVNVQNVTNKLAEDSWEVTSFINGDDGNESAQYNGYVLTFNANGTVTASYNGTSEAGTWSVALNDGRTEFYIDFDSSNDVLNDLEEDWEVTDLDVTTINAQDLDDEFLDTDDEFLELQKH